MNSADNAECRASGEDGQVRAADCTVAAGALNAPELMNLFLLVVYFFQNRIYVQRCPHNCFGSPPTQDQFFERCNRRAAAVSRGRKDRESGDVCADSDDAGIHLACFPSDVQ